MSFILFLSLVSLIGCASGNEIQLSPTSISGLSSQLPGLTTDTPALSLIADLATVEPTQPVPSITYTPKPSVTLTAFEAILPIQHVKQQCTNVQQSMPQDFVTEGIILLEEFGNVSETDLSTLQSDTATPNPILNVPPFLGGGTSIRGAAFMYRSGEPDLVVISPNGDMLATLDWDDSWESYSLLDDQRILFRHKGVDPVAEIRNPFTDSREMYTPDLPNFFAGYPDAHITYWKFVVDPNLETTAYMQSSQDAEFPVFVLWDMAENQALWTLDKNSVYFVPPVWSPDLSKLAVVAMNQKEDNWDRFELFIVDVSGNADQWIDLKGIYPDVLITDMKWSPDGRYLALLAPDNKPFLILDTSTQQLLDYCIPGNSSYGKIVWAPDSTQVIIPRKDAPAVVLDLINETAAQLVDDFYLTPVGWLAKEP